MSRGRVQTGKAANFRRLETGSAADPIRPRGKPVTGAGKGGRAALGPSQVRTVEGGGAPGRPADPTGPGRGFSGFKRRRGYGGAGAAGSEAGGPP